MKSNVQFLTSDLLTQARVKHGWFMRFGGVSGGLFRSLNGKKHTGDSDVHVDENRNRALRTLLINSKQHKKHITHIIHAFENTILCAKQPGEYQGYDASITTHPHLVLSQTTADCATIIVSDTVGSAVALIHGSWHTLKAGIIQSTVSRLVHFTQGELVAGIGPMICSKCYEFGEQACEIFEPQYLTKYRDKFLVDLNQMAKDQLAAAGVEQVDDVSVCTLEDQRFFSHRKNGPNSGRFITLAGTE